MTPETVRAFWRREISRAAAGNGTPDSPSNYAALSRFRRVVGYVLVAVEQENASG